MKQFNYIFVENLKKKILEKIESFISYCERLKQEHEGMRKFREEEDSDYIEPYLADLFCDWFMFLLEKLFLDNKKLLQFESFYAYVDNMKNSSSSKAYAKIIAMSFNLIIYVVLIYYLFLYWLGEFVFFVSGFIKFYLIYIPVGIIIFCALVTTLIKPIYTISVVIFFSTLLVMQFPLFKPISGRLFVKMRKRLRFLFICFFDVILIFFFDYFFYFFDRLSAGDLFSLFFDSEVVFLEFVYEWPYFYEFWNFFFFIYMQVWGWAIFFWSYIAQSFDLFFFSFVPKVFFLSFFVVFKCILPGLIFFLFFYYILFFYYVLKAQRVFTGNFFVYATLSLFIKEHNSKYSFLLNYDFEEFLTFFFDFLVGILWILFERFFLLLCAICSLSEVLWAYSKGSLIVSIDPNKALTRYTTFQFGGLLSYDELEFMREIRYELKANSFFSYFRFLKFAHPRFRLDVSLSILSYFQNGFFYFFGFDDKKRVYLQESSGFSNSMSPRFLSFRWENTLNYRTQYNFLTVSFLSLVYFFIGPFLFFSLPDSEVVEKISVNWDFSNFKKFNSQLTNTRMYFVYLDVFLRFVFKKDLDQVLLENETFEDRLDLIGFRANTKSSLINSNILHQAAQMMLFYKEFSNRFEDILLSYYKFSTQETSFSINNFDLEQSAKISAFERKVDSIKSDLTLKFLFQDVYIPRNFFNKFIGNPIAEKNSNFSFLTPLRTLTIFEKTPIELYDDFYDYTSLTDFYKTELKKKVSLNNFDFEILEMNEISFKLSELTRLQVSSQRDFVFTILKLNESILFSLDEINLLLGKFELLQKQYENCGKSFLDSACVKCNAFIKKLCGIRVVYQQHLLCLSETVKKYIDNKGLSVELHKSVAILRDLLSFYEESVVPAFVLDQHISRSGFSFSTENQLGKIGQRKLENDDRRREYDFKAALYKPTVSSLLEAVPGLFLENLNNEMVEFKPNLQQKIGFDPLEVSVDQESIVSAIDIGLIYKYLNINGFEWDNINAPDDFAFTDIDFKSSREYGESTEIEVEEEFNLHFRCRQIYNGKGFFYKSRNRFNLHNAINRIFFESTTHTIYSGEDLEVADCEEEQFFQSGFFHVTQSWDTSMLRRIRRDLLTIIARSPEGFLLYMSKVGKLSKQKLTHDFFLADELFLEFLAYLEACALRLADRHYLSHLYFAGKSFDQVRLIYLEEILLEVLIITEGNPEFKPFLKDRYNKLNNTFFRDNIDEVDPEEAMEEAKSRFMDQFLSIFGTTMEPPSDKSFESYTELSLDLAPYIEDKFESLEAFKIEYNLTDKRISNQLNNFRNYYKDFKKQFLEKLLEARDVKNNLSALEQFKYAAAVLFKRRLYFSLVNIYLSNYFKYYNRIFFLEKHFKDERELELPKKYYVGPAFRSAPLLLTRAYESSVGVWEDELRVSRSFADAKTDFLAIRDKKNALMDRGLRQHKEYNLSEKAKLFFGRLHYYFCTLKVRILGVDYYFGEGLIFFLFFFFFFPLKWLYEDLNLAVNDTDQFLDDIDEDEGIVENWVDTRDDFFGNLEFDLNNTFDSEVQDDDSMYNTVQASVDLGVDDELSLDAKNYKSLGVNGSYYDFESRYIARPGYVSPFIAANSEQSFEHWFFLFEWRDFLASILYRMFYIIFLNKVSLLIAKFFWFIFLLAIVPYSFLLLVSCLLVQLSISLVKCALLNIFIWPLIVLKDFFFHVLFTFCSFFFFKRILEVIVYFNMLPLIVGYRVLEFFNFFFSKTKQLIFNFDWFILKTAYFFLFKRVVNKFFRFFLYLARLVLLICLKVFLLYFYFIFCFQYYDVIKDAFEVVFFMKLDFRDFFLIYMMGVFLVILFILGPLNRVGSVVWELRYDYLWSLIILWVMMYFVNNIDYLTMHYWNVLDSRLHLYGPKYFESFWEHQVGYRNIAKGTKSIMALPLHSKLLLTFQPEWYNFHLKRFRKYLTHKNYYPYHSNISILQSGREFFYYRNWMGRGLIKESDYNYIDYHDIHNLMKIRYIASSLINYYDMLYGGFKSDPLHYIGLTGHRTNSWFRDHSDMQRLMGNFLNQTDRTHQYAFKYKRYTPKTATRRANLENSFYKKVYLKYYQDVDMTAYDLIRGNNPIRRSIAYTRIIQDFWYGRRFNPHERMFYFKSSVARVHLSPLMHGYIYVPDFIFFGSEGWGIDLDMLDYDYVNNTESLGRRRIFRGVVIKERFSVAKNYRNLFEAIFFGPPA